LRGCNLCEKLNRCVQRDYMDYVYDRIIAADCIVLAAPIYCMGLPAQAKALIDPARAERETGRDIPLDRRAELGLRLRCGDPVGEVLLSRRRRPE